MQKELFKSAMEVVDDGEKGDDITTPTDPNVSMPELLNNITSNLLFLSASNEPTIYRFFIFLFLFLRLN